MWIKPKPQSKSQYVIKKQNWRQENLEPFDGPMTHFGVFERVESCDESLDLSCQLTLHAMCF
jgi:hypothetical protein